MVEFAAKHQTLARAVITILVTLAWCLSAYVTFGASEPDGTVLKIADLTLSIPAGSVALGKRATAAAIVLWRCRMKAAR